MSKIAIIYTASTGAGHDQAAIALKENLETRGFKVTLSNPIHSTSKFSKRLVENGYGFMANYFPKVYGSLYHISHLKYPNRNLSKWLSLALENHIAEEINNIAPSLIISTHPFYVKILASIKASGRTSAALISVVTDLGVHRLYVSQHVDAYITGSEITNQKLKKLGVSPEKFFDFGIPVKSDFYTHKVNSSTSSNGRRPLNILIMGGSMGNYKVIPIINQLIGIKHPIKATVICGRNDKLKSYLESNFKTTGQLTLEIVGYTNAVNKYMSEADLLISKPGGLTLTEAIHSELPLLIPFYIHGQEAENAAILKSLGVSLNVKKASQINPVIEGLLYDETVLERLKYNMRNIASKYSIEKTAALCDALGNQ